MKVNYQNINVQLTPNWNLFAEREQRDLEQMPQAKRRRLSTGQQDASKDGSNPGGPEQEPLRPGDRGFVMRARVPMPSHKDYVVRPKWNVDANNDDSDDGYKKRVKPKSRKDERLEKHIKNFAERRKNSKMQRAVGISLEGNKMPLTWLRRHALYEVFYSGPACVKWNGVHQL